MPTKNISKTSLPLIAFLALGVSACGMSDEEVGAAVGAAIAAEEAADIKSEYEKSQDFDQIAKETVEGMDTSGLENL